MQNNPLSPSFSPATVNAFRQERTPDKNNSPTLCIRSLMISGVVVWKLSFHRPSSQLWIATDNRSMFKELPPIELAADRKESQKFDSYADFFSIIVAMEHLETAFVRDVITDKQ